MIHLEQANAVRCPTPRKHDKYDNCGNLLCVIFEGDVYLRCPTCKLFWKLEIIDDNNIILHKVAKSNKILLKSLIRLVS